jgi:hypothetical protein
MAHARFAQVAKAQRSEEKRKKHERAESFAMRKSGPFDLIETLGVHAF